MKKKTNWKAMVLSLAMTAVLSMPVIATAQTREDGLFGTSAKENIGQRDGLLNAPQTITGINLTTESYGAPVGSGLLILTAIGAGYAAFKKKKEN